MCRLFGFRSKISSQVHHSLLNAENALAVQSEDHPDGWGVCYYIEGVPHVVKSSSAAINDQLFQKVSGIVSSNTVLAHVRKATLGQVDLLNTHPFQYGPWIFAHNGNLKNYAKHRNALINLISPFFRRFLLGDTDSEVLFYIIMTRLQYHCKGDLTTDAAPQPVVDALRESIHDISRLVGPCKDSNDGPSSETYLTFLLTNGRMMVGHRGGKDLHYSTYKTLCREKDTCSFYSAECEAPSKSGFVNHLIFSSEPLEGDNIWRPLDHGEIVGSDFQMKLFSDKF